MAAKRPKKSKKVKIAKSSGTKKALKNKPAGTGRIVPLLIVLAVTLIVFIPSLSNDFVNWDDDVNIIENVNLEKFNWESIKNIFHPVEGHVIGNYNPLTIFTFAIEKHLVGLDATLYHVNNLILHLLCTFLVYRLMLLLRLSPMAAMLVALFFGIHPMRVESVAWITERKDVLFGAFYLGALCLYARYVAEGLKNKKLVWIVLGLFVFSLLSKIQAVALPLTMLAVDYYFKRPLNFKLIIEKIPFFALSLFFGLLGIYTLSLQGSLAMADDLTNYSFFDRLLIGAYSWIVYLIKVVVPYKMVALYPYPKFLTWQFYVAPFIALGTVGAAFWAYKKEMTGIVFGFLVFFFNVVFMLQILGAGQGFIADRFTYIPYLGLFFMVGYYYDELNKKDVKKANTLKYVSFAFLAVYAFLSFQQIKTWKNGETLWTHAINNLEATTLPYGNRGFYFRERKEYQKALVDYNSAIQLNSSKGELYNSRGKTYFDMNNVQPAIEDYRRAIALDNTKAEFHVNLGAALGAHGNIPAALQALNAGVAADPEFANAYLNRSLAYSQQGQFPEALKDVTAYLKLKPYNSEMWYEKGLLNRILGKNPESIQSFTQALQLDSSRGEFFYQRGRTYAGMNQPDAAKRDLLQAQQMGVTIEEDMKGYLR